MDPLQFGKIKNSYCSTTHAIIHRIHNWLVATDNPRSTIRCCMIDFSTAFDHIDLKILMYKLQSLNVPPILLNRCADVLLNRQLGVKLDQDKSSWRPVYVGVPRGTKLDLLFFLVMINDLKFNLPLYKYVDQ